MVSPVRELRAWEAGFVYMGLLAFVAILGIGLSATGVVFHQQAQREKEAQLLFVGAEIRRAIGLYYELSPGTVKQFPRTLDDLLLDRRYPGVQRYLRRIYVDPMTGTQDWILMSAPDGGINGVHSAFAGRPLKTGNFPAGDEDFKDKASYTGWQFVYVLPNVVSETAPARIPPRSRPPVSVPDPGAPVKK